MRTLIVIPARYGSKRFPGKPLAALAGKPILERVWEIARKVCDTREHCSALVATEDPADHPDSVKIVDFCRERGIPVALTPASCQSGSDRVWATCLQQEIRPEVIINLQGDNPVCPPEFLIELIDAFRKHPETQVATPFTRLTWEALDRLRAAKQATPFSGTTVIAGADGNALWFSKNIIPGIRKEEGFRKESEWSPVCRHIGLYAYRFPALAYFANAPLGRYERLEQLEQLRFLENGIPIRLVEATYPPGYENLTSGIDTPQDLERAAELIRRHGELLR